MYILRTPDAPPFPDLGLWTDQEELASLASVRVHEAISSPGSVDLERDKNQSSWAEPSILRTEELLVQ